jgi:RNA polymerase sigma-70 factor (ECF subfamily)
MIFVFTISDDGRSIIADIYDKYHKRMLFTASQILGKDRGEDAVHDVFVKLFEMLEKNIGDLCDKPGQYFVIIVRNHSLNNLKSERLKFLPLSEELEDKDIFQSPVADLEETLIGDEAFERLVSLIRRLTPATRQVLEYRYIEGYSNMEIAEMLGISQSAVSTRIDRAKKRLRELLESEEAADNANQ